MIKSRARLRWFAVRAGAVFAAVAMVEASSSTAGASCLHDVTARATRAQHAAIIESLLAQLGGEAGRPVTPKGSPHDRGPCTGAACSGMPGVPQADPVSAFDARAEMWAAVMDWSHPRVSGLSVSPAASDDIRPIHLPDPIFHPPRPAALAV